MSAPLRVRPELGAGLRRWLWNRRTLSFLIRPSVVLSAGLLLFAVWLRCRYLGYSEMWADQSVTLNIALHWLHGGALPLAADPSSSGLHNPPLVVYLYALPLLFKPDILGVVWLITLVNLLGLLAAGLATARVFGWRVAWWACLLLIVNPWAVSFSRLIWMPSFVPGFSSMLYACLLLYFAATPRPAYLILGALCFAAVIQTHMTAIALVPMLGLVALVFRRRLKLRPLLIGAGLFGLCFLPFILFQFQTGFSDFRYLQVKMGGLARTDLWLPLTLLLDLLHSVGAYATQFGPAGDLWRSRNLGVQYTDPLIDLLLGGAVVYAVAASVQLRRAFTPRAAGAFILLLWLCLPLPVFIRHSHEVYNYYFFFIFPAPFVLIALFAERLNTGLRRWLQRLPTLASGPAARGLAAAAFLPLAFVAFHQGRLAIVSQDERAAGITGTRRVVDMRQAIGEAKQLLAVRPQCQLVVLQEEALAEYSQFGLLKEFVDPARVRFVEAQKSLLIPAPCAVYLAGVPPAPAWQAWLDQNTRRLPDATIHTPQQTWVFYDLPADHRAQAVSQLQPGAPLGTWANGAQLLSLTRQGNLQGASLTLTYNWAILANLPPETNQSTVHSGNYLLTPQNKLVAQVDGVGFDSRDWRPGDVFRSLWELPLPNNLPPGDYQLATAFYELPEMQRVPLTGGDNWLMVGRVSKPGP
jgi:hypothetical protein